MYSALFRNAVVVVVVVVSPAPSHPWWWEEYPQFPAPPCGSGSLPAPPCWQWEVVWWKSSGDFHTDIQISNPNITLNVEFSQHYSAMLLWCLLPPVTARSVSQQQLRQRLSRVVLNILHKTLNEWVVWTALHCRRWWEECPQLEETLAKSFPPTNCLAETDS